MDTERAVEKMREVRAASESVAKWFAPSMGNVYFLEDPGYKHDAKTLDECLGAAIRIADRVDADLGQAIRKSKGHSSQLVGVIDEVIGRLLSDAEIDEILEPEGPRLSAKDLHPWVWHAAVDLWSDGYHREALQTAATAVFDRHLPAKLGIQMKPADLVGIAFSLDPPAPDKPRLRMTGFQEGTDSWKNAHEGARYLGIGCVKAIRNLSTHELEHKEQRALEQLACLSTFARWVSEAELVTV